MDRKVGTVIVFSDLDGTLLDRETYSVTAAAPALAELERRGIPVVFATSKTSAEVVALRRVLANHHPSITENGGGVDIPAGYFDAGAPAESITLGTPYEKIRTALETIRKESGFDFIGFGDMSAKQVASITGLLEVEAIRAQQRRSSEPLVWTDTRAARAAFERRLRAEGLVMVRGGRFWHVQGDIDKAAGVGVLRARFQQANASDHVLTIAAGDSPNDRRMLEACDISIVVRPPDGDPMRILSRMPAILPERPGPAGFNVGIMEALNLVDRGISASIYSELSENHG